MKSKKKVRRVGVYIGRFDPVQLGHEAVTRHMNEKHGEKDCLLLIGSQNHPMTMRHFFSYKERKSFIQSIFPKLRILGIPDFETDEEWIEVLREILAAVFPAKRGETIEYVFYSGNEEDVSFFIERGYSVEILNRFDGTTVPTSASAVRDALRMERSIEGIVPETIREMIHATFTSRWEVFSKK